MRTPGDRRGQSEVLGVVLLLGLTVVSVGAVVAAGSAAVDDTRTTVQTTAVENAMYRYDAAVASIAYGTADRRRVSLGRTGDGQYTVRPDRGWVRITHRDYDGSTDQKVVNRTLGALVYENGDTEIAYQGGLVLRSDGEGSVLLSSPRIEYHHPTVTIPLISVRGSGSAAGSASATLDRSDPMGVVYPNGSKQYDATGETFANPLTSGSVAVTVKSRYYKAWEDHFRTMGDDVTVERLDTNGDGETDAVRMVLPTAGVSGNVALSEFGFRGIKQDEHAIRRLNVTLPGGSNWNSLDVTMSFEGTNGREYRARVMDTSGQPCKGGGGGSATAKVTYENETGTTYVWKNTTAVTSSGTAFTYDCGSGPGNNHYTIHMNLTESTNLTYQGSESSVTFDEHDADIGEVYDAGTGTETVNNVTNHYVALLDGAPSVSFTANSGNVNFDDGSVSVNYENGTVINYLRVTNATVETELS